VASGANKKPRAKASLDWSVSLDSGIACGPPLGLQRILPAERRGLFITSFMPF
jgi:hypothetical protein